MNRRGFIGGVAAALAGFSILPAATTYTRLWKAVKPTHNWILNPEWVNAPCQVYFAQWLGPNKGVIGWRREVTKISSPFDPYPHRYVEKDGTYKWIPPFIKQPISV